MARNIELGTLVLRAWRDASRHVEIDAFCQSLLMILEQAAPVKQIVVRRIDIAHSSLETVGVAGIDADALGDIRSPATAVRLQSFLAWPANQILTRNEMDEDLKWIIPSSLKNQVLAAPLGSAEGRSGVLLLVASSSAKFDQAHVELVESIVEPVSVALENDRRNHEMAVLREAAEADRRSLLARLGRRDVGGSVVGADSGLKPVMERVELVSQSDVPVLILGETGTGKELIARAIHTRSPRHERPFIRVNCGAIPAELIDSQLFGHERGSFTGAVDTHKGWFERADSGTLFLDEIGELPLPAQVRLLRVLQDGFIERVGGHHPIHVDVRIVAATHRDLAAMTGDGRFREDLWYRLAVFPIPLPPLRERVDDIPALACHLAERAATRFGLPLVMPSPDDLRLLSNYAWPGNVRELGAVIDRAALLGNGRRLEVAKSLGVMPSGNSAPPAISAPAPSRDRPSGMPASTGAMPLEIESPSAVSLEAAMRQHIEAALVASHGRVDGPFGAANRLRINPHTLRARMRKLGISPRLFRQKRA